MKSSPHKMRFPKARRLTRSSEFERVKTTGQSIQGRFLLLGFLAVGGDGPFRAGIITSKRIGEAIVRNRVRRRIREVVRTEQRRVRNGLWLVLIARRPAVHASYATLKDEWLRLADRASILAP